MTVWKLGFASLHDTYRYLAGVGYTAGSPHTCNLRLAVSIVVRFRLSYIFTSPMSTLTTMSTLTSHSPVFQPEWIWGDDEETTVFAQGFGSNLTVIFSFSLLKINACDSLASRICNKFHGLQAPADASFPDSTALRKALWDAVHGVWPECILDPGISSLDAIVYIDSVGSSFDMLAWKVYHHPKFSRFVQLLSECGRT
jgi:hypothetical protein